MFFSFSLTSQRVEVEALGEEPLEEDNVGGVLPEQLLDRATAQLVHLAVLGSQHVAEPGVDVAVFT